MNRWTTDSSLAFQNRHQCLRSVPLHRGTVCFGSIVRDLKSLTLEGCAHVSDTGVAELAKMSTGLTYLNISRCERVGEYGDRALIQLGRSCHQLKGLDAFGCSHAQVSVLRNLLNTEK